VEFRGTLSMLLDRMEGAAFEVGVFGRVSSGKSSLLNYILQTNVLPIGVTPVTAIPTRISHGPIAEAGIELPKRSRKSSHYPTSLNLRRNRKIRGTKSTSHGSSSNYRPIG
jgi:GTPase SAR1 family protein